MSKEFSWTRRVYFKYKELEEALLRWRGRVLPCSWGYHSWVYKDSTQEVRCKQCKEFNLVLTNRQIKLISYVELIRKRVMEGYYHPHNNKGSINE